MLKLEPRFKKSNNDAVEPMVMVENRLAVLDNRTKDRKLKVEPNPTKSNTLKQEPQRECARTLMEEPREAKLRRDMDCPIFATFLQERLLPSATASRILIPDPNETLDKTERLEPRRVNARKLMLLPT
jgi:hypothetical protein